MAAFARPMACCKVLIFAGCFRGISDSAPLLRFCPAARVRQSVPELRTTTDRGLLLWFTRTTCVVPWLSGGAGPGAAIRRGRPRGTSVVARTLAGRRGEGRTVGTGLALDERVLQGQASGGHAVVLGEDKPFGAVLAELGNLVVLQTARLRLEGLQDVLRVLAGDAVEMEEVRVQLGSQLGAALFVPSEGVTLVTQV